MGKELTFSTSSTQTITEQATDVYDESAYVPITGDFTAYNEQRMEINTTEQNTSYIGRRDVLIDMSSTMSVGTGNSDELVIGAFHNGELVNRSLMSLQMSGTAGGVDKVMSTHCYGTCTTGGTIQIRIANLDSTTDITVSHANIMFAGTG